MSGPGTRLPARAVRPNPTLAAAAALLCAAASAGAQTVVGPSKCTSCHDHGRQAAKWQKEEPAQLKGKAHYNTRKQLEAAKSTAYAKAIGLADPYDVKGSCVRCHATVFRGDANAGVSCESCHGPASAYLEPHQVKGSYARSLTLGMRDLKGKPPVIGRTCVSCHLTKDARLVAAGHPSGAGFDAGRGLRKIVHWTTAYDFAAVTAAGKAAMGPAAARAAAAAPPARGAAPVRGGTAPPAPEPTGAAAAPWDWSQPIRALPSDYVPEPVPAAPAPGRPARPAPARAAPSLAEDLPLTPAIAAIQAPALAAPPPPAAPSGPRSVTSRVAEARGSAAAVLARVLRAGTRSAAVPPASPPREYRGPDGELLRLQDEALALALEALRRE